MCVNCPRAAWTVAPQCVLCGGWALGGPGSGAGCSGELGRPSSVEGVTSATHGSPPPGLGAGPGLCEVTTPPQTGDMAVTQSDGHLLS